MILDFYVEMNEVPTTTAQQKKFNTRTKTFYKTTNIKHSEGILARALSGRQPTEPFTTPIKLTVWWIFPLTKKAKNGEVKGTRPDIDNLQKLLQDIMCRLGYYKDDSLIVELNVKKAWHEVSGLRVRIEEVPKIDIAINKYLEKEVNTNDNKIRISNQQTRTIKK